MRTNTFFFAPTIGASLLLLSRIIWSQTQCCVSCLSSSFEAHSRGRRRSSSSSSEHLLQVWKDAEIDYSAANEFIDAHYNEEKYFPCDRTIEPIYNARKGFWDDTNNNNNGCGGGRLVKPSLAKCGFELRRLCPTVSSSFNFSNWENLDEIRSKYLHDLRYHVLKEAFSEQTTITHDDSKPSTSTTRTTIRDIVFWQPMYRGEDLEISGTIRDDGDRVPTASIASLVHIDSDIGAYRDAKDVVELVANNRLDEETENGFSKRDLIHALESGHRFCIVNIWRNAQQQQQQRAPLAMLSTKYSHRYHCFPQKPNFAQSRWYAYEGMEPNECLLFLQYDRNVLVPSDLWHCAIKIGQEEDPVDIVLDGDNDGHADARARLMQQPRRSFDVRALIVFEEKVPPEADRFRSNRRRPVLTKEESGCFCESQSLARDRDEQRSKS